MHQLKHKFDDLQSDGQVTIVIDKDDDDLFQFEYPEKDRIYGTDLPNRVVMERISALEVLKAKFEAELSDIDAMLLEMKKLRLEAQEVE